MNGSREYNPFPVSKHTLPKSQLNMGGTENEAKIKMSKFLNS
jgi:hypothetical protein